jgi:uncharacterized protein YaiI (UPF0178 family)
MPTIYIDADACPVKPETYRVAVRHAVPVVVVANNTLMIPENPLISSVAVTGFGAADDWIAGQCKPGDICITSDIPLAARVVAAGGITLHPKGRVLDDASIGEALGMRDLMEGLREAGTATGGPSGMTPKDRSKFLSELDRLVVLVKRKYPAGA